MNFIFLGSLFEVSGFLHWNRGISEILDSIRADCSNEIYRHVELRKLNLALTLESRKSQTKYKLEDKDWKIQNFRASLKGKQMFCELPAYSP